MLTVPFFVPHSNDTTFLYVLFYFRYDVIFPPDRMWGSLVDGVWNGFPRLLQTKVKHTQIKHFNILMESVHLTEMIKVFKQIDVSIIEK